MARAPRRRPAPFLVTALAWAAFGAAAGLAIVHLQRRRAVPVAAAPARPVVAVYLEGVEGLVEIPVVVEGPYEVRVRHAVGPTSRGEDLRGSFTRVGGEVVFPSGAIRARAIEITPLRDASLLVGGRRYRGALRVRARTKGGLRALNLVAVEDYLGGVVGPEIGASSPPAALEAQAVAARTYAMVSAAGGPLSDGTSSQVYRGVDREDPRVTRAIERTRGRVLLWQGKPFPAYFHSTCGGRTTDAAIAFGSRAIEPLAGVACGFCDAGKFHRWEARLPASLLDRLAVEWSAGSKCLGVREESRDASGRWTEIAFAGDRLTALRPAKELRTAVNRLAGGERIRSTLLEGIRAEGEFVVVSGRGWGHGVGLCQVGAIAMAKAGHAAGAILARYYPGATAGPEPLAP